MDFDVIVVGGGINGLTSAAYLAKAGAKVIVLERRGECGAHCSTDEPGIPGFMHNLHATWMITAISPAVEDLELEKYGFEPVITDYVYGKTFLDGKCALLGVNPQDTVKNWMKLSEKDANTLVEMSSFLIEKWEDILRYTHDFLFKAPKWELLDEVLAINIELAKKMGINITAEDAAGMNGFQILDLIFESDYIKTLLASLSWIGGFPPIHRRVGAFGCAALAAMAGPVFPVHQLKGGSHMLTHALVKACIANGAKILTSCPVDKILVENGQVKGVQLSKIALYPGEKIYAERVISDLSLLPTFLLVGGENIPNELFSMIKRFYYDEQVLFGVHYALKEAPVWKSADFDPGIQRCFMGYFGGETQDELERFAVSLVSGRIHDNIIANWFIPTIADPSQAPDGCHTAFVWFDVPPAPIRWGKKRLEGGFQIWDKIKSELAEEITNTFEKYAPGFKKNIIDVFVYSPLDTYRNNPSAIRGNWLGGSMVPEQFFTYRPLPGVIVKGASRTFIKGLYLSNSIHPMGATWLSSGYISACEVAEDMGIREREWWRAKAVHWYINNLSRFPRNLGVDKKWRAEENGR